MSLKSKINDVVKYIHTNYPNIDFNDVSISHSCVLDICNTFFYNNRKNITF